MNQYRCYQLEGINFMLKRKKTLLADDTGLGKTVQAVGLIDHIFSAHNVLVICPVAAKAVWEQHFHDWCSKPISINRIKGLSADWPGKDPGVVIINYDILTYYRKEIRATKWDAVIMDEAHRLKNIKSQMAKEVYGYGRLKPLEARYIVAITATPLENRPVELWQLIQYLRPDMRSQKDFFERRYCGAHLQKIRTRGGVTRIIKNTKGSANLEELSQKLKKSIMIRRTKAQVQKDLPDIVSVSVPLAGDMSDTVKKVSKLVHACEYDFDKSIEQTIAESIPFEKIALVRKELAEQKLAQVIGYVQDIPDPQVIFAHHRHVVEALHKANPGSVFYYGGMTEKAKEDAIAEFMSGKTDVFIGNFESCRESIDLTRASHVIFAEFDWRPTVMYQALSRVHRASQDKTVCAHYLYLENSFEAYIAQKCIGKKSIISKVMGGKGREEVYT